MKRPQLFRANTIRSLAGDALPPVVGLLTIFAVLTLLFAWQQVLITQTDIHSSGSPFSRALSECAGTLWRVITLRFSEDVRSLIVANLWRTLVLVCAAVGASFAIGVGFGVCDLMARERRWLQGALRLTEIFFAALPGFLVAWIVWFGMRRLLGSEWPQGEVGKDFGTLGLVELITRPRALLSYCLHLIAPAVVLACADGNLAYFGRTVRAKTGAVEGADFIHHLHQWGYGTPVLFFKHILPHAFVDLVYLVKYRFAYLLSSAAVVELIFNRPGISRRLIELLARPGRPIEDAMGSIWLLCLIVLAFVIAAGLWKQNASAVIVRGYYPIASRTYDAMRSVLTRSRGGVLVLIFLAFTFPSFGQSVWSSDTTATVAAPWAGELATSAFTTVTFVLLGTLCALSIGILIGVTAGLSRGRYRASVEQGVISAFDIIPKLFIAVAVMAFLTSLHSFQGSVFAGRIAVVYCLLLSLLCWNEIARNVINRMDAIYSSPSYASAVAIGCGLRRRLAVYFLPGLVKEALLSGLKVFLLILYLESALSYCSAGLGRFTQMHYFTLATFFQSHFPK